MKIQKIAVGALLCLLVTGAAAKTDDKAEIDAVFFKIARAISARDPFAALTAGTADLTYTEKGRVFTGEQMARKMQAKLSMLQGSPRCRITVLSVQVKGGAASAMTSDIIEAETSGRSGRMHRVAESGRSRNLLVRTKQGWRLKSVYVLSDLVTMDGKQMNMSLADGK